MQRTLLAGVLALACAPCIAQDFDVEALYQKWLKEENRTLEGHKVLDDNTLIEKLSPLRIKEKETPEAQPPHASRASFLLAVCYIEGVGGAPSDWLQAREIASRLRDVGFEHWSYLRAREEILFNNQWRQSLDEISFDVVVALNLEKLAKSTFPAAMTLLAYHIRNRGHFESGTYVHKPELALDYIKQAADAGCLPAIVAAGLEYVRGTIWGRDSKQGLDLLERAADEMYAPAWYELGRYYDPKGQKPDLLKAREYYQRAAKLGDRRSMDRLAELPPKPIELYTVSEMYEQYVNAWGIPSAISDDSPSLHSPPNQFLSRFKDVFEWLRKYLNEEDKLEVTDEHRKARAMFAECLLHGIGGAEVDRELAVHWLNEAGENPAALLLWGEYASGDTGLIIPHRRIIRAIEAEFPPAVRFESWAVLRDKAKSYERVSEFSEWDLPNPKEALETLGSLVENGDVQAAVMLAEYYRERDAFAEWEKWGTRAAELGHAQSALLLGEEYFDENTANDDPEKARRMFELALYDAGTHAVASERLAWLDRLPLRDRCIDLLGQLEESLLRYGEVDEFLARHPHIAGVAQRASMDGHSAGHILYALCLLESHGIGEDDKLAQELLLKHSGQPVATYLQGRALETGRGGRKPDLRGARWCYETVAAVDGAYASFRLAEMYRDGAGVDEDQERAFEYFEDAAEGGCLPAMVAVAKAYRAGDGVEPDADKALEWIKLAAAEEYEPAETLLKKWQDE